MPKGYEGRTVIPKKCVVCGNKFSIYQGIIKATCSTRCEDEYRKIRLSEAQRKKYKKYETKKRIEKMDAMMAEREANASHLQTIFGVSGRFEGDFV